MHLWSIILTAGQGSRLAKATQGNKKQFLIWKGLPLFWHSAKKFSQVPDIKGIIFVFPPDPDQDWLTYLQDLNAKDELGCIWKIAEGGAKRQDSAYNGILSLPVQCDAVLIHDAARPFLSSALIQNIVQHLKQGAKAVVPALAVKDTIKQKYGDKVHTLPRDSLYAVQTPQGFCKDTLFAAHDLVRKNGLDVTDDASMLEQMNEKTTLIPGEESNSKITSPEDLALLKEAENLLLPRTGWGYDVHRYGEGRPLKLGGIPIPGAPQVVAHSDGDVLLHALIDALLGCLGQGDIGDHFPDSDPKYANLSSAVFLAEILEICKQQSFSISQVDLTLICQTPKLSPWKMQIRKNIASLLGLALQDVNLKATTEEGLGFTGEKKGIKAVALVSGCKSNQVEL
jgi:2-C-methyl-D-erythritol 4-phosphate cytidylyltransferase/2-C-methyl-D-erythritol 2,4-cyclodiphosphate synthase